MHSPLVEKDLQYVWHPFTPLKSSPEPIAIIKGEGVYLFDEDGNRYIDAISSWWVNLHGHAHPYIAEKIYEQAKQLEHVIFAGFTHSPAVNLAERLLKILPGKFSKIFFSDNGSTSTEVAIKMALQYWWNLGKNGKGNEQGTRNKILAFNNSYHGDTFGAMSVSDRSVFTLAFQDKLFEVIFIDTPPSHPLPAISSLPLNEIACFIYEPLVQGAGGMRMYEAEVLNELLRICKQHDIICIADEVMTGFGRTGKLFASEYCEEKPDIICLSKGLTGGTLPMGITACTQKIVDAYITDDKLKTFFHGHSYTANPLACAAALASLDLLQKEDCAKQIERIEWQHQSFSTQIRNLKPGTRNKIKNLRQTGTILAFEIITEGKDEYLNNISAMITKSCLRQGVYIRPLGNTVYIMPPYCITEDQLQKVYATLTDVIENINPGN